MQNIEMWAYEDMEHIIWFRNNKKHKDHDRVERMLDSEPETRVWWILPQILSNCDHRQVCLHLLKYIKRIIITPLSQWCVMRMNCFVDLKLSSTCLLSLTIVFIWSMSSPIHSKQTGAPEDEVIYAGSQWSQNSVLPAI